MKRIGVLGGISPQATMDFEARVHRISQQLIPQDFNRGYPPMVVWYHRRPPVRLDADGRAIMPMEVDPELVEAAAWLGKMADFLVIPCNAAHVGLDAIQKPPAGRCSA
jgi:aspartate racemase